MKSTIFTKASGIVRPDSLPKKKSGTFKIGIHPFKKMIKQLQMGSEWTQMIVINLMLIMMLYMTSIGLVFYQRWYLKQYSYPLFLAASNQFIIYAFSGIYRLVYHYVTGKERVSLSWKNNIRMMAILGAITSLHMGLSNFGLELNTVSLFTVSKSTNIIFIMFLVLILRLEKFSWKMVFIVTMIATGMALFTYQSPQLNILGLIVTLMAAFMSASRWTLAQYVFHKSDLGIENPIDLMYYVDLWVFVFVLPMTAVFEGVSIIHEYKNFGYHLTGLTMISAMLAFCMEVSKYLVLQRTSSISVSVIGIMQEIGTIIIAHVTLHEQMSVINFCGLVLCMSGATCHAIYKYKTAKKKYYLEIESIKLAVSVDSFTDSDDSLYYQNKTYLPK